jgi:hypothetical protein
LINCKVFFFTLSSTGNELAIRKNKKPIIKDATADTGGKICPKSLNAGVTIKKDAKVAIIAAQQNKASGIEEGEINTSSLSIFPARKRKTINIRNNIAGLATESVPSNLFTNDTLVSGNEAIRAYQAILFSFSRFVRIKYYYSVL